MVNWTVIFCHAIFCNNGALKLTLLFVIFFPVISIMMHVMHSWMMSGDRRYQRMIAQRWMRMMRMMMTEESDRRGSGLMLSLHTLLDLTLHLSQNRMMRRPSCQMERKHRCRSLKQPGRGQQGSTGGAGAAARRQRKGQTTSRLQDHFRYQFAGVRSSLGSPRKKRDHLITDTPESCVFVEVQVDIWRW